MHQRQLKMWTSANEYKAVVLEGGEVLHADHHQDKSTLLFIFTNYHLPEQIITDPAQIADLEDQYADWMDWWLDMSEQKMAFGLSEAENAYA